jgi:hypothetical protein
MMPAREWNKWCKDTVHTSSVRSSSALRSRVLLTQLLSSLSSGTRNLLDSPRTYNRVPIIGLSVKGGGSGAL